MSEPEDRDYAQENTDYIGAPVDVGEDVLANTPQPDEDSGGKSDYLDEDDTSAGLKDDPLQGRPAAT
jgi:hypothetical protein